MRAKKIIQIIIVRICSFKSSKLPLIKNPSAKCITLGFALTLAKSPIAIPSQTPPIPCKEKTSKESSYLSLYLIKLKPK